MDNKVGGSAIGSKAKLERTFSLCVCLTDRRRSRGLVERVNGEEEEEEVDCGKQ
jgi:hypothetical protein